MAPRNSRGKAKGEKKKKEEKVLPVVTDITVNLPDETHVVLKGISTDRIIDVRRLLCENTVTCGTTSYSLSHEVRGPRLKDTVDVAALKPCVLTLVEEDYDEESAVAHVRRLLDIVACTACFGAPGSRDAALPAAAAVPGEAAAVAGGKEGRSSGGGGAQRSRTEVPPPPASPTPSNDASAAAVAAAEVEAEMSGACPKLGSFYDFFSLSHLTPPLQFIRRPTKLLRQDESPSDDHLFYVEVKLCNGKLVTVEAQRKGFYSVGKHRALCHDLVELLRRLSRAFDNAYEDIMKAFSERNKFGNLPYGFRANTWLVPPFAACSPSSFPPLPVEDESWGGNGGGWGRDGKSDMIPWSDEFLFLTTMPCKTAEERQIRDRKVFLLHSLFVDVSIFRAVATIRHVMENTLLEKDGILHNEQVGDISVTILRDASDASCKLDTKIDGARTMGTNPSHLIERNLLKGITADENTVAHDVATLGTINVRYCGYVAVVKVNRNENRTGSLQQRVDIEDQPEGGANALNVNSLRLLLHKKQGEHGRGLNHSQSLKYEDISSACAFIERVFNDSLARLETEKVDHDSFMRWELGACWIQHLQDQKSADKDKKQMAEKDRKQKAEKLKNESKVEGLGKPLRSLRNSKKKKESDDKKDPSTIEKSFGQVVGEAQGVQLHATGSPGEAKDTENEQELKKLLSEAAFTRLKESETGLHQKVKLSEKLSHVQSLCIHEMIVRAFKHVIRSVIAAVTDTGDLAVLIAAALNMMLGAPEFGESNCNGKVHSVVWRWLEMFLRKRYEWELTSAHYRDIRKFAILRGLCHKVTFVHMGATIYQQKALDINERELGLDHPDTMKSYGDLAVFYYRLQHTELALKYVKRALYLLHLTCGPSHPNTAATYINVAMMEEGLGNVHVALRYLHKALKCNQKLLGPDHIQTAASYHAIAIALSLMEAYTLSVQHEQTTLRILRAKLGPDDLRTQVVLKDAAAWLEYFESKAIEQQEAARNGTRKPDASIASKGHLSVSDLLDYINPNQDSKGRDIEAARRRNMSTKVRGRPTRNLSSTSSDAFSKDSSESTSEEEKETNEPEYNIEVNPVNNTVSQSENEAGLQDLLTVSQELSQGTATDHLVDVGEPQTQVSTAAEDGWQPVQRPKSYGIAGQRLRHRHTNIGKIYSYSEKDISTEISQYRSSESYQNNKYYFLKKRTASSGHAENNYVKVPSPGSKIGRKVVRSVTYRVKYVPTNKVMDTVDNTGNVREKANPAHGSLASPLYDRTASSSQLDAQEEIIDPSKNHFIANLGNSPSYKDVALAPPGTVAKVPIRKPKDASVETVTGEGVAESAKPVKVENHVEDPSVLDITGNTADNHKIIQETIISSNKENEVVEDQDKVEILSENVEESSNILSSDIIVAPAGEISTQCNLEAARLLDKVQGESLGKQNDCNTTSVNATDSIQTEDQLYTGTLSNEYSQDALLGRNEHIDTSVPISQEMDCEKIGILETSSNDSPKINSTSNTCDVKEIPNKKLSASATPFNPSAVTMRGHVVQNIRLPLSSPISAVAPWPVAMQPHPTASVLSPTSPMCTSPHRPYPASPQPPSVLHPMPFAYPPYSQAQAIPTTMFPMNTNVFHPNHFAWQCNLSPNVSEFVPGTMWAPCHPIDFPVIPPVISPVTEAVMEPNMQSNNSESLSSTPLTMLRDAEEIQKEEIKVVTDITDGVDATEVWSDKKTEDVDSRDKGNELELKSEIGLGKIQEPSTIAYEEGPFLDLTKAAEKSQVLRYIFSSEISGN
ncbi:hypothetical protein Taro_048505 [Colocasia esculenta]|uniref:Clu domain-containing protein n=1 Tax=Colocasia esculenta TaxID=4460 RepID=A0A843X8B4_COLES|nr:hypothetical protein [Colocasia esculenta]